MKRQCILMPIITFACALNVNALDPYQANGIDLSNYAVENISFAQLPSAYQSNFFAKAQHYLRKFPDLRLIIQIQLPVHSTSEYSQIENTAELKAHGLASISFTVSGIAGTDLYFIDHNDACIRIPGHTKLAEGRSYFGYVRDAGVFEYITVLGAARRIPKYEYIFVEKVTIEDIKEHLLTGNTVFIPYIRTIPCPECRGQGRRTVHKDVWERGRKTKNKLVTEDCPRCRGKKTMDVSLIYTLTK